jgi:hypothetical protein
LTTSITDLRTALLDLLYETRQEDLRLIIGGGYGIYLKREHLHETGERTLFKEWPEARSTNDLDLFLRPELLIASEPLKPLRQALATLGFNVVKGAEKYQFAKPGPTEHPEGGLKVDFLTGPRKCFEGSPARVEDRRVQPRPRADLHAHWMDEALTLEEGLLRLPIEGKTSGGAVHKAVVYVPHPFTFAMMKLYAFRDREDDPEKEYGRYHALDVYSVLAMATEPEWEQAKELSKHHQNASAFKEAVQIVHDYFSSMTSLGMIRMQESPYCRPQMQLDQFVSALSELFPPDAA